MKTILILANNDVGLFKFRKELIQELVEPGSVISNRVSEPCKVYASVPDGGYCSELEKIGAVVIDTPMDRRGMNPKKDIELITHYFDITRKITPDVVLTYTIKPNIYGGSVCRIKKIPYISNVTGLGTSIESGNVLSKIILRMYKSGLKSSSTVFFQNRTNKAMFESLNIVKNNAVLIPGSGVNVQDNPYEKYPDEKEPISFLFVGRIMKDKGIGEFLDCAESIHNDYPNIIFSIVGDYDENEYRTRINEMQKLGIIHYYGQQDDVHAFMKKHYAIVLPSYHEGLSNVLLESASTGRPIITCNIPGCAETFEEGVTGLGVIPRNAESLIETVRRFVQFPYHEKRLMGIKAREKIEREFDRRSVIKAYLDAINKLEKYN